MVPDVITLCPQALAGTTGAIEVQFSLFGAKDLLGTNIVKTGWFHFMPHTVLKQIAEWADLYKAQHGQWPSTIAITDAEHAHLKHEMKAAGNVVMINGITVIPGVTSNLPQPVPAPYATPIPAPIKDPFGYLEKALGKALGEKEFHYNVKVIKGAKEKYADQIDVLNKTTLAEIEKSQPVPVPSPFGWHETPMEFKVSDPVPDLFELTPHPAKGKAATKVKVYHLSGSDEHGTPQDLFDTLNSEFHFDLDVCATEAHETPNPDVTDSPVEPVYLLDPGNAKCPIYFTQETDGLKQNWFGTVWMNPPYTKGQVGTWLIKLIAELAHGQVPKAVALVAARPDTAWFHMAAAHACEIRFLKGRLTFQGSTNPAPFPSAVLVFDTSKLNQVVKFWDWKQGKAVKYAYQKFGGPLASGHPLLQLFAEKGKGKISQIPAGTYQPGQQFKL